MKQQHWEPNDLPFINGLESVGNRYITVDLLEVKMSTQRR